MIKMFREIARESRTIKDLAISQKKSVNWITEVLQDLERGGFIVKKRSYEIKGSRIAIELANTEHAAKFKDLIFQYPTIKFEELLSDSKLLFLAALTEDWMTIEIATNLSKISKYMVERYRPMLMNRGIIVKKGNLYKINDKAWPKLKEFLAAYRNYSRIKGYVKWKYQDEVIFEVDNEDLIQGTITGFSKYADYGIKVNTISILCRVPKEQLSKEEIFVHSLFELNDPRTLYIALTFYIKDNLIYKKVMPLAIKYGKYTLFENFIKLLDIRINKIKLDGLPEFERNEFNRIANIYGVKNV